VSALEARQGDLVVETRRDGDDGPVDRAQHVAELRDDPAHAMLASECSCPLQVGIDEDEVIANLRAPHQRRQVKGIGDRTTAHDRDPRSCSGGGGHGVLTGVGDRSRLGVASSSGQGRLESAPRLSSHLRSGSMELAAPMSVPTQDAGLDARTARWLDGRMRRTKRVVDSTATARNGERRDRGVPGACERRFARH
jgi:hypothetical protein